MVKVVGWTLVILTVRAASMHELANCGTGAENVVW
jgi:hypothetical protein